MAPAATLIGRVVYGVRNAFAHLAASLEKHGILGTKARLILVEEDPLSVAREEEQRGRRVLVLYGLSTPVFLELAGEVARVARRYPVVAGGPHAEGAYWQLLRLGVWAAVVGDGENALPGLVEALLGERELDSVPNIAYSSPSGFRVTRIEHVDLDNYPPHHRGLGLFPPIEIMRGCPYRCRFCQVPWLFKARVRFRSLASVLEAVDVYVSAGKKRIRFIAPIGFAYLSGKPGVPNIDALEALLRGTRERGGTPFLGSFPSETRPEYVTPEVLELVRRYAGNRRISVGLQSGSNRVLSLVGRGHSVEDALEAVNLILRHGFTPVVDLIFGLPGEEEEDVEATVAVMQQLASQGVRLRLHTFLPLPGTPLAEAKPRPIHPFYRETARRLLGRGVIEGDWESQESLARRIYCATVLDPSPSREPRTRWSEEPLCRDVWAQLAPLLLGDVPQGGGYGSPSSLREGSGY